MRKSNCCKAELLPRTVLCSKCLSEVKVRKLTAEDFIEDNVLKLPFKDKLSVISSIACNSPRFNKTLIINFELDKDGTYKYNLPEDMDKVRVERRASYVVKYGKHVNKIKSLDEVGLTFFIRNNQVIVDAQEFTKLKKSDLVLTFRYGKKNEAPSEKIDVCDREKSLKSFIYNLNIAGIENISKDRNKILKSNLDFLQLLSYANVNLHVTRFMDSGNGEVHVDFGTGFLPSIGPSVFTFITKWEYLDQILIKKMVVPISPVPMSKCSLEVPISKCSLDNLPFPIKIGDKVLFQNSHALLKYFNIGYHVLNGTFDNKYIIQNIYKTEDLFVITISDNYDLYKSHPLSHVDIFTLFGSDNTLGVIVNPIQQYNREVIPMQQTPYPFGPINVNPGFMESGQIHKDNIKSRYNLDGMGYFKAKSMSKPDINTKTVGENFIKLNSITRYDTPLKTILNLGDSLTINKDLICESLFINSNNDVNETISKTRIFKVIDINTNGCGYVLTLSDGDITLVTMVLSIDDIEKFFTVGKGRGFTLGFTYVDESNVFETDGTTDKKFDEPIKDEKIVPARIDDDNLFSIGDYVTIKDKDLEKGIANGIIKNPFGWGIFDTVDDPYVIVHSELNIKNTETIYVFRKGESYYGFTVEADKAKEIIRKILFTVTSDNIEEDENITKKQHQEYITDLDAVCYYSNIPLLELCSPARDILRDKRKSRNRISKISKRKRKGSKDEQNNNR